MSPKPKPPIRCTPCRVTIGPNRWRIYADGSVSAALNAEGARHLGLYNFDEWRQYEETNMRRLDPHSTEAKTIRREASRLRRNRAARERTQVMKDLGLKRGEGGAFGGWE